MYNDDPLPSWLVFLAFTGGFYLIKLVWSLLSVSLFNKRCSDDTTACDSETTGSSNPSSSAADVFETGSSYKRCSDDPTACDSETIPVSTGSSNPSSSSADVVEAGSSYDVFLSFRGSDTRKNFTDHLYTSLIAAGIRVFRDNEELLVGEEIGGSLLEAITQSKISIPIFSKDFASSKWCLKEVAQMVKCKNQLVLPIFYDVTPHEVRHQSGTYEEAFTLHSKRYQERTVEEWRKALSEIGGLKGWELQNFADGHEGELVRKVVSEVWRELRQAQLIVKDSLVGVEDSVEEIMHLLKVGATDVRMVGIYGIGGIGKTTLAKLVYNQLLEHFEHSSFIKDVREMSLQPKGLEKLQTQLLSDILKSGNLQSEFPDVDQEKKVFSERLKDKKVLILLDDVDSKDQINALAANISWFKEGSRILITTRNKDSLDVSQVRATYEMRPMHSDEALLLFCMYAFKRESPTADYANLSKNIVDTTGGLPLALEVIGSFLYSEPRSLWEETFEKLQNGPCKDVRDKLRISYETLEYEEKQIFLDIACFFIGTDKRIATYMWRDCQFHPDGAIKVLLQRCLIKVGDDYKLWMHDQLRDLGREIARKQNDELSGRKRLWSGEVVERVLHYQQDAKNIEATYLDFGTITKGYSLTREQLMKLCNLKFLVLNEVNIAGEFWYLPFRHLRWPLMKPALHMENLVILNLSHSNVKANWGGWKSRQLASRLKVIILKSCQNLEKTPDLSEFQLLERLDFEDCRRLSVVDPSIGKLKNLIFLSLKNCSWLWKLPQELSYLRALVELHIDGSHVQELPDLRGLMKLELLSAKKCQSLSQIPPSVGHLTSLSELSLDASKVSILPDSIGALVNLRCLSLRDCKSISQVPPSVGRLTSLLELSLDETIVCTLPDSIGDLVKLTCLSLSNCYSLRELPVSIGQLTSLKELRLSRTKVCTLPDSIGELSNLQMLLVNESHITHLPHTIGMLEKLEVIDASKCTSLRGEISKDLVRLCSLTTLNLEATDITMIPENISRLSCLENLLLGGCKVLQTLPQLPSSLRNLSFTCISIQTFLDVSICTNLLQLKLTECLKLKRIHGLGRLINLKLLMVSGCPELAELNGLEKLECLKELRVDSCKSLESLPSLSNLKMLRHLSLSRCKKLGELKGLEELKSLKVADVRYSPALYHYTEKCLHIRWEHLPGWMSDGFKSFNMTEYKVFLSLRGQDITDSLFPVYDVDAFIDDREPTQRLIESINRSKISIPIFSKGYASSTRCLRELVHILECKKNRKQLILPIFYDVAPDQVQKQQGCYEEAFKQHIKRFDAKTVEEWRAALRDVGALRGWELQYVDDEHKEKLVKRVLWDVLSEHESSDLDGGDISGIKDDIEKVMELFEIDSNDVRMVGIYGMAGAGKTTLAKVIYNKLKQRFAHHSFLSDIREKSLQKGGLKELRSQLLLDIRRSDNPEEFEFVNVDEGINVLRQVDKRVLIVVDGVDHRDQLNALVPHNCMFAPGSKIIITTRNKEALDMYQLGAAYELNGLKFDDALAVFCKHACGLSTLKFVYEQLSGRMVRSIGRLPLALEVIGSSLRDSDRIRWYNKEKALRERRTQKNDFSILRMIYKDMLDCQKEAFLNIACFLNGTDWGIARHVWCGDWLTKSLFTSSLIKIDDNNELWMHSWFRDLGREIVQQEKYKWIWGFTLWCREESKVLSNQETQGIDYRDLRILRLNKGNLVGDFGSVLPNLEWLSWHDCPNQLLVTNLWLARLLIFELSKSNITDDWNGWRFIQRSIRLKVVIIKSCQRLTKTPDFSVFPELERLILEDCTSLEFVDPKIKSLKHLEFLSVKGCSRLDELPQELSSLKKLSKLHIDRTSIKEIPAFKNLKLLSARKCKSLLEIQDSISTSTLLCKLELDGSGVFRLPDSIQHLRNLKRLSLSSCRSLREIPYTIVRLYRLEELDLSHTSIRAMPDTIEELKGLKVLNMSGSSIENLPSTLGELEKLQVINVSYCRYLNGKIDLQPMRLFSLRGFIIDGTNVTLSPCISGILYLRTLNWAGCRKPRPPLEK